MQNGFDAQSLGGRSQIGRRWHSHLMVAAAGVTPAIDRLVFCLVV
jgi:hypothetical protein